MPNSILVVDHSSDLYCKQEVVGEVATITNSKAWEIFYGFLLCTIFVAIMQRLVMPWECILP
jgi:hypothetical protein